MFESVKREANVSAVRHRRLLRMVVNVAASGAEGCDNGGRGNTHSQS